MNLDIISTTLSCDNVDELALEIKKIETAAAMSALLVFCKKNSAYIAKKLNKTPSQISKTLSGDQNLTIKTILEFSLALDFDFDITFHSQKYSKPKQPWHVEQDRLLFLDILDYMSNSLELVDNSKNKSDFYVKNLCNGHKNKARKNLHDMSNIPVISSTSDTIIFNIQE